MYTDNVKFYLKDKNSDNETPIYARVMVNGKPFKYGIRKSIYPDLWDSEMQRPTRHAKVLSQWRSEIPQIKPILQNIEIRQNKIADWIVGFVNLRDQMGESYDYDDLRDYLDEKLNIVKEKDNTGDNLLLSYYDKFIEGMEDGTVLKSNKRKYALGTIKTYKVTRNQLEEYQIARRRKLSFDDITMGFYEDLLQFFFEKDLSQNTIGNNIKHLKVIMERAQLKGLHDNEAYRDKRFKVLEAPSDSIYLTEDEIERIRQLDLRDNPVYGKARDLFLICYYTGLRIEDALTIRPNHFRDLDGNLVLELAMQKIEDTSKVIIPVKSELKQILERYSFRVPRYPAQKVNMHIKEIGKLVGIDDEIEIREYKGGQSITRVVPKYSLIKTHTGRRSIATHMDKRGIHRSLIKAITGHKTDKSLDKYLKTSIEEKAGILANHEFFK